MKLSPARQVVIAALALALLGLQIRLWFGEGSVRNAASLRKQVHQLKQRNDTLAERNRLLAADVHDLKDGTEAIEEIARKDLGMIRDGETFFLIVPPKQGSTDPSHSAANGSDSSDNNTP